MRGARMTFVPIHRIANQRRPQGVSRDFQRGKRYARITTAAMHSLIDAYAGHALARTISARGLELIFEAMIRDGIVRRVKGGGGSRATLTPAMSGFLSELARYIAGIRDGS